jgi:hypothetical protein
VPSQRQHRLNDRQLNELRATRDNLQTEVNDNVPAETSGLEEALRVSDLPIQSLGFQTFICIVWVRK